MGRLASHYGTEERYGVFRVVGVLCTGIGVALLAVGSLLLVFGLLGLLAGLTGGVPRGKLPFSDGQMGALSIFWSLGFLASGLQFLAMGALFRLAIHVEENTRSAARSLEKIRVRLETKGENAGTIFRS
jgi:hypothetical protein